MPTQTPQGLSDAQVKALQAQYGTNDFTDNDAPFVERLLKRFFGPIQLMIEAALVLSAIAGQWGDFAIIIVLLSVNIGVDILQESRARTALLALKAKLAPTAQVVRNSLLITIPAHDLVPGDVLKLTIGDVVPADATWLAGTVLEVDQSAVTGESLPVEKNDTDMLYSSSIVTRGDAYATVTAIGLDSSLGKNAALVSLAAHEKESHFQKAMLKVGKALMIFSSVLIFVVFVVLILRETPLLESVRFALVLAIASIPVALPAVLSVTMALGAATLARRQTVVSHFQSVEELAGIDELCVDKTGTLTRNQLEIISPVWYDGFNLEDLMTYAFLAIDESDTSPIEKVIHTYANAHGYTTRATMYQREHFVPFNPTRKLSEVSVATQTGERFHILMGAPQVIQAAVTYHPAAVALDADITRLAQQGFRVIAVAKDMAGKIVPVGLIPLIDPPRDDAKTVIEKLKHTGVRVRMLTGDNSAIASYVASSLGIGSEHDTTIACSKCTGQRWDAETLKEHDVFAEVVSADKYQIIASLQTSGHIVGMTGDGVNDAPALKKADVGIAVSGATAAARSAADIVLLQEGLSVIQTAIQLARQTFARMQAYALFRISETIRVVLFVALAIIVFQYIPLTPVMIIILALLNDIPVLAIAYDNAPTAKKPVRWHLPETLFIASLLGVTGVISSFGLLYWLHINGFALAIIQTILFLKLDVAGHSTLYLTRTGRHHFWHRPFPSLTFFLPAFSSRIIGTLIAVFGIFMEPISWSTIGIIWVYATVWFFINDQIKVLGYRVFDWIHSKKKTVQPKGC